MIRRLLLGAALGVGLVSTPMLAQSVSWPSFTSGFVWPAASGVGGQSAFLTSDSIIAYIASANTAAIAASVAGVNSTITTKSGSGAATSTATGGTLCWKGTAPTTWAVTFVAAPANGTVIRLCSDTTLTSMVSTTAGSGDTMNGALSSATITANTTVNAWQYNAADKVWYKVQ